WFNGKASARSDNAGAFSFLMRTFCIELSRQFNEARPRKTTQLSESFQGTEGRFYWLSGLRRSCFVVNQTMAAKASYQKANKSSHMG
ncbi:MAG: hypothetical protein OIF54_05540, partial [Cohaesibacter sp.]|nr:hypothetical protein [Cohaesibacter sp.]